MPSRGFVGTPAVEWPLDDGARGPGEIARATGRSRFFSRSVVLRSEIVEFRTEIGPWWVVWWSQGRWMEESSLTRATATP